MRCFDFLCSALLFSLSLSFLSGSSCAESLDIYGSLLLPDRASAFDTVDINTNFISEEEESSDVLLHENTKAAVLSEKTAPDSSANAFVIICAVLVICMSVPGIGLFYGGLVRAKNVMSVLAQCMIIFSISMLIWMLTGYSLVFSGSGDLWGNFDKFMLLGIEHNSVYGSLSEFSFVIFQGAFCAISACLITGSPVGRIRFSAMMVGTALWVLFSYVPLAHMVWGGGFIERVFAAYDFAGGTVVHINAAVAALVLAKMTGDRSDLHKVSLMPHSLPLTYIGCGFLWIGWFGFNAGSALIADGVSALAFANTVFAPAAAAIAWILAESKLNGKASALGAASGVLAGLVAVTPACAYISPIGAVIIGIVSSCVCLWGVRGFKRMVGIDDSLDVFGIHGLGAIVGALLTGVFCDPLFGGVGFKGDFTSVAGQLYGQLGSVLVTVIWSGVVTFIAFKAADRITGGLRVSGEEESMGLDLSYHGERGYNL